MNPFQSVVLDEDSEQFHLFFLDQIHFGDELPILTVDFLIAHWVAVGSSQFNGEGISGNKVTVPQLDDAVGGEQNSMDFDVIDSWQLPQDTTDGTIQIVEGESGVIFEFSQAEQCERKPHQHDDDAENQVPFHSQFT